MGSLTALGGVQCGDVALRDVGIGHGGMGEWLGWVILEIFSNLNDSMLLEGLVGNTAVCRHLLSCKELSKAQQAFPALLHPSTRGFEICLFAGTALRPVVAPTRAAVKSKASPLGWQYRTEQGGWRC